MKEYEGPLSDPGDEKNPLLLHVCEVCGKEEILTANQAFALGWDYPPKMGKYGVVSACTCGSCTIDKTVWWALTVEGKSLDELTDSQKRYRSPHPRRAAINHAPRVVGELR